jgi:hypothetical protein
MSEKEHTLRVTLDPEMWSRFVKVKEALGARWNSNVLRYLISLEYFMRREQNERETRNCKNRV